MTKRPPVWLLPNLLSLDAPLVALAWMWLFSQILRVQYIELSVYLLLAGAVWCVYVLDRIRDVKRGVHGDDVDVPWRHRFHWKMRWMFIALVCGVVGYSAYYALFCASRELLTVGIVGGFLVFVYWLVSLIDRAEVAYAKNFVAGMTFAFGVAAPIIVASEPLPMVLSDVFEPFYGVSGAQLIPALVMAVAHLVGMVLSTLHVVFFSIDVILFGLLCVMNINAIDLWERSRKSDDPEVKQESELALSMGLIALLGGAVFAAAFVVDDYNAPLCYAVMVSVGLIHLLNRARGRFSLLALRVLVDLALVLPVPFAVWLM